MGYVNPKFDWYSAVWSNCSFDDVFKYYGDFFDLQENWHRLYEESRFCFDCLVISSPMGIQIRVDRSTMIDAFPTVHPDEWNQLDPDCVWNIPFKKIKVDFSGSGLDFLRNTTDIDSLIRYRPEFIGNVQHKEMHITRIDVAFDYINECANIMYDLKGFLDDPLRIIDIGCLNRVLAGDDQAMNFSYKWGAQRTIYVGSTGSDRLLRIYDKKFQLEQANQWSFDRVPYRDQFDTDRLPNSWIRFEMQLRNANADQLLFSDFDYFDMLRYMYDHFKFRKGRADGVIPEFEALFDWSSLQRKLLQKPHFVQSETPMAKLPKWIQYYLKTLVLLFSMYKPEEIAFMVQSQLQELFHSDRETDKHRYRYILNNANFAKGFYDDPKYLDIDRKSGDPFFTHLYSC